MVYKFLTPVVFFLKLYHTPLPPPGYFSVALPLLVLCLRTIHSLLAYSSPQSHTDFSVEALVFVAGTFTNIKDQLRSCFGVSSTATKPLYSEFRHLSLESWSTSVQHPNSNSFNSSILPPYLYVIDSLWHDTRDIVIQTWVLFWGNVVLSSRIEQLFRSSNL
jgi:hypothetical protein